MFLPWKSSFYVQQIIGVFRVNIYFCQIARSDGVRFLPFHKYNWQRPVAGIGKLPLLEMAGVFKLCFRKRKERSERIYS